MGWVKLETYVKLPEQGQPTTVTHRVDEDGDYELVGYDIDTQLRSAVELELGNLRSVAAADLRAEGKPDDAQYIEEIAMRLESAAEER
jgi:hypothetical protein